MSSDQSLGYIGDELSLFAHATNWKRYWGSKISPILRSPVLEVGAGIGSNTKLLYQGEINWTALEPDTAQAKKIEQSTVGDKVTVINGVLSDLEATAYYQTILYIDVLEHIFDDEAEVELAVSKLKPGGHLIVLSPAHNQLFSPFDEAVGHFRRYDKRSLSVLTPQGADVEKLFYLDSVGCLASLANSLILRASMPTKGQIRLWDGWMVPLSRLFDKLSAYTFGKTIIMVWRKSEP